MALSSQGWWEADGMRGACASNEVGIAGGERYTRPAASATADRGAYVARILFWNLNRLSITNPVVAVAKSLLPEVLILAEAESVRGDIQKALASAGLTYTVDAVSKRFVMCFRDLRLVPVEDGPRVTVRRVQRKGHLDVLLVAMHLPSKLFFSQADQTLNAPAYADDIRRWERDAKHERTVVVGDLNMSPFDPGVVGASGFHAVSSRAVARRGSRKVDGRTYPFFYNPSWRLFARDGAPPASYYRSESKQEAHFWYMLDQVLVRPALLEHFQDSSLRLVTAGEGIELLSSNGEPCVSDHLPLYFELNLPKEVVAQ